MDAWFNPDSWMDSFVILAGLTITAGLPTWLASRNHKTLKEVKEQVTNGHANPLRMDMDMILTHINEISKDIDALAAMLVVEEADRRTADRDLRHDWHEQIREIEKRLVEIERFIDRQ
jgi:hypothetical protein